LFPHLGRFQIFKLLRSFIASGFPSPPSPPTALLRDLALDADTSQNLNLFNQLFGGCLSGACAPPCCHPPPPFLTDLTPITHGHVYPDVRSSYCCACYRSNHLGRGLKAPRIPTFYFPLFTVLPFPPSESLFLRLFFLSRAGCIVLFPI